MSHERFVLDTNVVISAVLLPRSVPRQAFNLTFIRETVLVSEFILDKFLELAMSGNATCIISGDADLNITPARQASKF
jgi:predicted nucleic acid-binding protein